MFNLLSKIIVNKFFTFAYFSSFQMSSRHDLWILDVYEFKLGHSAAQATRNINISFGDSSATESTMRRWFAKFRFGDFDLRDDEGRKLTVNIFSSVNNLIDFILSGTLRSACLFLVSFFWFNVSLNVFLDVSPKFLWTILLVHSH